VWGSLDRVVEGVEWLGRAWELAGADLCKWNTLLYIYEEEVERRGKGARDVRSAVILNGK
jgi:hypothetical protein